MSTPNHSDKTVTPHASEYKIEAQQTYLRAREICGPQGLLRVCRSKFYSLVAAGVIHKPLKCGNVSLWEKERLLREFRAFLK